MHKTELRLDPLTEAWTIFSEGRGSRPAFGSVRKETSESSLPDPFIAGREHLSPHTLHSVADDCGGWVLRVTPNRAPVLRIEGDDTRHADGFYDRMDGVGAHEVIIETPGDQAFEELSLAEIEKVISAWKIRMLDLMRDPRMRSFTVIKNVGRAAGGLTNHAVSQLVGMAVINPLLKRKLEIARQFYEIKKRSIFEDILSEEVRAGVRLVYENNGFAVFCPYAARSPFEMSVFPKRQCADFHGLTNQECAQLADVLRSALRMLGVALGHPPYNLMLFTAPTRTQRQDHWTSIERDFRWHIEILPRLQPLGGIEFGTGCWVNSVWPEVAADCLRGIAAD
jgi:UDPglucose--hexose-1-phosphate uridylyltransferase